MAFGNRSGRTDWKARDDATRAACVEVEELCARFRLPLPWGPYRAAAHTCFKCGKRIVVYTWAGHRVRGSGGPPAPHPRTLKQRTTRESGGMTYWVNTCAACGITQGDNYLYDEGGDTGPPPFRYTWSRPLPTVPGGSHKPEQPQGQVGGGEGVPNVLLQALGWGRRGRQ
jgi:hypothetical protein